MRDIDVDAVTVPKNEYDGRVEVIPANENAFATDVETSLS